MHITEEKLIDFLHERFSSGDGPASDSTVQAGDEIWPPSDIPDSIHIDGILELGQLAREIILLLETEVAK